MKEALELLSADLLRANSRQLFLKQVCQHFRLRDLIDLEKTGIISRNGGPDRFAKQELRSAVVHHRQITLSLGLHLEWLTQSSYRAVLIFTKSKDPIILIYLIRHRLYGSGDLDFIEAFPTVDCIACQPTEHKQPYNAKAKAVKILA